MKKMLSFIVGALLFFTLIGCQSVVIDDFNNTVVETQFINKSEEYHIENNLIDLYYFNDVHLPYVDVIEFINLLEGLYYLDVFEFLVDESNNTLTINIEIVYDDDETIYNYLMTISATNDTILVDSMDFFYSYLVSTETDYGEGLIYLDPIIHAGSSVNYELGDYDFDIINQENAFLMPLVIANLVFNQGNYFDVYYNGVELYGIDTSDYNNSTLNQIIKSPYNNQTEPDNLKIYNYNFYRLLIDYFYGLNEGINVDELLNNETFLSSDSNESIYKTTNQLDELHSAYLSKGFYNNKVFGASYDNIPYYENVDNFYTNLNSIVYLAAETFGTTRFGYLNLDDLDYFISGDTMFIYLLGFDVDTPNGIEEILKNAPSNVNNIVIDLSLNTGGNLGAVLRMFTLFTEKEVWYHSRNPLDGEMTSYGVIGENQPYDDFTYYIKTSAITFSAANLTASIAKELDFKVIGSKSAGGASGVGFFVFPNGAIINLSSNFVLTDKSYNSIENGIVPDIIINDNDMFNHNKIIEAIKNK